MKRTGVLAGLSLGASLFLLDPSLAAGFTCPDAGSLATPQAVAQLDARLTKGIALEQSDPLAAAIALLREHGLSTGNTIDHLIAFFCPAIVAEPGLSDADKRLRVLRFAPKATRLVYGQNNVEEVIYDVPLKPGGAEAAAERARAASLTLDALIAQTVEAAIR